jgi:hypothetical protein
MSEGLDNVRVYIRVRPLSDRELAEGTARKCVNVLQNSSLILDVRPDPKRFTFDYIGDETTSQQELFEVIGKPISVSCLDGYNGTIFAYGQTGAGKTFTIQGTADPSKDLDPAKVELRGLLPRSNEFIFECIEEARQTGVEFSVRCSYLEIYQEQIIDLLSPDSRNLNIREDIKDGVYVEGLIEQTVSNCIETMDLIKTGARNRHVGQTSMNMESSRSHSVFTMLIESRVTEDGLVNFKSSRFHLIDLAGSERQKLTDAAGDRLKEAGMINKSLSALGNVINSLVDISEGRSRHVHYRDSKLTFLLKDSLGGNSKTCIVAAISPAAMHFSETLSTLKFAQRAKLIKNRAVVNEDTSGTVGILKEEVRRLKEEVSRTRQISELTAMQCPKCTGAVVETSSEGSAGRVLQLEKLLEHNLRLRLDTELRLHQEIEQKNSVLQSLQTALSRYEKKVSNDKMVLKFRDSTIARLQANRPLDSTAEVDALREEIQMVRDQLEFNPLAAKLFAENEGLKQEIERLKTEKGSVLRTRLQDNEDFTAKLADTLKESVAAQEQAQDVLQEMLLYRTGEKVPSPLKAKLKEELEQVKSDSELKLEAVQEELLRTLDDKEIEEAKLIKKLALQAKRIEELSVENEQLLRSVRGVSASESVKVDKILQSTVEHSEVALSPLRLAALDVSSSPLKSHLASELCRTPVNIVVDDDVFLTPEQTQRSHAVHTSFILGLSPVHLTEFNECGVSPIRNVTDAQSSPRSLDIVETYSSPLRSLTSEVGVSPATPVREEDEQRHKDREANRAVEDLYHQTEVELCQVKSANLALEGRVEALLREHAGLKSVCAEHEGLAKMKLHEAERRVEEQQGCIKTLQGELDTAAQALDGLQMELSAVRAESHEVRGQYTLLTESLKQETARGSLLAASLKQAEDRSQDIQSSLEELKANKEELLEALKQETARGSSLAAALMQVEAKDELVQETLKRLTADKERLIEALKQETAKTSLLTNSVKQVEASGHGLQEILDELRANKEELIEALTQETAKVSGLSTSLSQAEVKDQGLQGTLKQLTAEQGELLEALRQETAKSSLQAASLKAAEVKDHEMQETLAELKANKESLQDALKQETASISLLSAALKQSESNSQHVQGCIEELTANKDELQAALKEECAKAKLVSAALKQAEADKDSIRSQLQESSEKTAKLQASLLEALEDNQLLVHQLKTSAKAAQDSRDLEVQGLKVKLRAAEEDCADLAESFRVKEKEATRLMTRLSQMEDEVSRVSYQLIEAQSVLRSEKEKRAQVEASKAEQQTQLQRLEEELGSVKGQLAISAKDIDRVGRLEGELAERTEQLVKMTEAFESTKEDLERSKVQGRTQGADCVRLYEEQEKFGEKLKKANELYDKTLMRLEFLSEELMSARRTSEHQQQINSSLAVKNAELQSELASLKEDQAKRSSTMLDVSMESASSIENLKAELMSAREEIKNLREENRAKMDILQSTNKNILTTRVEIDIWKRCIDENSQIIADLRKEVRAKTEELSTLKAEQLQRTDADDAQNEVSYLNYVLQQREKELNELKEKGQLYYAQADEAIEFQRKEIDSLNRKLVTLQTEAVQSQDALQLVQGDRDTLLNEMKRLSAAERIEDVRHLLGQMRDFRSRLYEGTDKARSKGRSNSRDEASYLKGQNLHLAEELKRRTDQVDSLHRQLQEARRGKEGADDLQVRRQVVKQYDEIKALTEGLTRVADFVFSLPIARSNPEETSIVESTIKGISSIYDALQCREAELREKSSELLVKSSKLSILEGELLQRKQRTERPAGPLSANFARDFKNPVSRYHALLDASSIKSSSDIPKEKLKLQARYFEKERS